MIFLTKLTQHQQDLRELEGIQAKFSIQECVLGTPAVLESVLGKSSAILVCLPEFSRSHDVTCVLSYLLKHRVRNSKYQRLLRGIGQKKKHLTCKRVVLGTLVYIFELASNIPRLHGFCITTLYRFATWVSTMCGKHCLMTLFKTLKGMLLF